MCIGAMIRLIFNIVIKFMIIFAVELIQYIYNIIVGTVVRFTAGLIIAKLIKRCTNKLG